MADVLSAAIRQIADLLQQQGFEFRPQQQIAVESKLREMFGGERVYIGKTSVDAIQHVSQRDRAILRDWRHGEHVPVLARRYGLSDRHIRRIVQPDLTQADMPCLTDVRDTVNTADNEPVRQPSAKVQRRR